MLSNPASRAQDRERYYQRDQRVDLRGFSAGSFAGLSTLHLLWKIPNVVTNGKLGAIAWSSATARHSSDGSHPTPTAL